MECTVNREIRDYREGVFFGLNMRQSIWGGAALVIAGAANFGLRMFVGKETASVLCILLAALPAAIGFMSYQGLTFEQFARAWLRTNFRHAGWYVYRAVSLFDILHRSALEKRKHQEKRMRKLKKEQKRNVQKKKAA
ncbi:MAG TPA: PrgI family protein [Candidatus Agathobaculum pullicola]|nr:PrgI family protein [Candidatus Agathobaculum pullicola]